MRTHPAFRPARAAAVALGLLLVPAALSAQTQQPVSTPEGVVPAAGSGSAAPAAAPAAEAAPRAARVRRDPNRITAEELAEVSQADMFAAVQALRPRWLQVRGRSTIALNEVVQVYVDGVPMGSPGALRNVQTRSVRSVRFLNGGTATQRYGTDHGAGAILIELL